MPSPGASRGSGPTLPSQGEIDDLIAATVAQVAAGSLPAAQPVLDFPAYRSSRLRHPTIEPVPVDPEGAELFAPVFGPADVEPTEADLTAHGQGEPIGERIRVWGRVVDSAGRPVRHQLVEVWQANAAGRYAHVVDQHRAPLDPNFRGVGRCLTDADGRYAFTTIRPGPYPWNNHDNAWRPAHIHFSFFGRTFTERLVTQMYFPGDPLVPLDPVCNAVTDPVARDRLVARYDHESSEHQWLLAYRWDVVLGGRNGTWVEPHD